MADSLRLGIGGVVLSLEFEVGDRFFRAAEDWSERQMTDPEEAMAVKAEQSLLEIEHLVSGAHDVSFEVDGRTVVHRPTEELQSFLTRQADATGLDESTILKLHVDLFARAFLDEDSERPPNAPPPE